MDWSLVLIGFGASLAAGLATGLGAVPMLFVRTLSERFGNVLLGFAAGVMLAASFFSLILPGLDQARQDTGSDMEAAALMVTAILLGAGFLFLINRYTPHEHFVTGPDSAWITSLRQVWLFIFAMTLHNIPEGLAVGVGFGGDDIGRGVTLAVAIGLQNMAEGLAVAAVLRALNYSAPLAVGIALATGLVEPVGGFIGITAVSISQPLLPWGLGFAAGAMIFVVSNEILPETHRKGQENLATSGLMLGLTLMMFLDLALA